MQVTQRKKTVSAGVDMTPMIDIIFQLIIFFMLVAQFQELQTENVKLPDAEEGKPREEQQIKQVVINVLKKGEIVIAGRHYHQADVTALIAQEMQNRGERMLKVIVRADQSADFGHVQDVMRACAQGGAYRVAFAVLRPGGEGAGG